MMTLLAIADAQDYDVTEIQCSFASAGTSLGDMITAKLKKPIGFKGHPLFADDRSVSPENDYSCTIKSDRSDLSDLNYDLKITDFTRCGVLKRNGFVHVRIWFPQFPGVVMQSDQELIIMCKPPEPTVIQNKAAGFAGSFPHGARVSGVVEETPGRLEYEVALYKEAPPPLGRINGPHVHGHLPKNHSASALQGLNNNEVPVDQAVPIGTKLQLRARISLQSVWKYVKLMEVTVSPDPDEPHAVGSVSLVRDGCRNRDFASIIPHQPARYRDRPNEVFLDFEAFLLSSMKERSTLWIHSQIKACMDAADCQPDFCLDIYDQTGNGKRHGGHGRKRRAIDHNKNATEYTKFKENLQYTVLMPGELSNGVNYNQSSEQCRNFVVISGLLAGLLALSTIITCGLASRLQSSGRKSLDDFANSGYAGRAVTQ
ncbi:CLUMA_CG014146, isoform A [Clunio marinus]|uniref:CLUMA_CG014146, isoform A n=1 Tax=Clunio marinus TaxID=568069 RepID=A0A1J1IKX8_9DIPT|nr:CLUMA_CG014146, isoform A [Clunio marinus]